MNLPQLIRSLKSANDLSRMYICVHISFIVDQQVRSPTPILVKNDLPASFAINMLSFLFLQTRLVFLLPNKSYVAMFLFQNHPT